MHGKEMYSINLDSTASTPCFILSLMYRVSLLVFVRNDNCEFAYWSPFCYKQPVSDYCFFVVSSQTLKGNSVKLSFGQGPSRPPHLDEIQKNSSFSRETFPYGVLYPPGPSVLTATAAMAGGTQLFEGAHLSGWLVSAFCGSNHQIWIILGFGSNGPHTNKNPDTNVPLQIFGIFIANSALSRVRALWGVLLAKIWWRGALKHFNGPSIPLLACKFASYCRN